MNKKLSWIADLDSGKVNIFSLVQIMSSRKPGKYLFGKGKSNGSPYVVGVYFDDIPRNFVETRVSENKVVKWNFRDIQIFVL